MCIMRKTLHCTNSDMSKHLKNVTTVIHTIENADMVAVIVSVLKMN